MPRLSIIIVTYNHERTLPVTLRSVLEQRAADVEILVYDNGSTDKSLAIARAMLSPSSGGARLRVIQSRVNRGFAAANNDAVRLAAGDLILLVNPDLELTESDTLARLIDKFDREQGLGIVGFKLLAADRETLAHCGGTLGLPAHTVLRGRGERDHRQYDQRAEVDFVEGAALATTRETWHRLGGFNEDYWPGYYEDTDLCVRARAMGIPVSYLPEFSAIHHAAERPVIIDDEYWRMLQANRVLFTWNWLGPWKFLSRALPAEWKWLVRPEMKYLWRGVLRGYARFLKRRLKKILGLPILPPPDFVELSADPAP